MGIGYKGKWVQVLLMGRIIKTERLRLPPPGSTGPHRKASPSRCPATPQCLRPCRWRQCG